VVLVGWVATTWVASMGAASTEIVGIGRSPPASEVQASAGPRRSPPDPERASARELRRLPGIGETRALEIVRDRWARRATGAPLEWASIRGVGPLTERRIREALAEGNAVRDPP
jgi:DNA uptake protein ComE-like DNA-binding protein